MNNTNNNTTTRNYKTTELARHGLPVKRDQVGEKMAVARFLEKAETAARKNHPVDAHNLLKSAWDRAKLSNLVREMDLAGKNREIKSLIALAKPCGTKLDLPRSLVEKMKKTA